MTKTAHCSDCGTFVPDVEPRRECPNCRSTARTFSVVLSEHAAALDGFGFKHRRPSNPGRRKVLAEGFARYEASQLAPLVRRELCVDRGANWYTETVTCAATGRVLHSTSHPLTEHVGRGDAKRKRDVKVAEAQGAPKKRTKKRAITLNSTVERARCRYIPPGGINVLFIAEAPPAGADRFFYFERVDTHDWLYLALMRALYPDARGLGAPDLRRRKPEYLQRFKSSGYYLLDACDGPMPARATKATKRRLLRDSLPALIRKVRGVVAPATPAVLISSNVYGVCYAPLRAAGVNIINEAAIDFPSSGRQRDFQQKFNRVLDRLR